MGGYGRESGTGATSRQVNVVEEEARGTLLGEPRGRTSMSVCGDPTRLHKS